LGYCLEVRKEVQEERKVADFFENNIHEKHFTPSTSLRKSVS